MDDIKFAAHDETASARPPRYYGVHHLALNTRRRLTPGEASPFQDRRSGHDRGEGASLDRDGLGDPAGSGQLA